MSMAHHGIFNIGRIQTQLLHPANDLIFDRIIKNRVQDDDALRSRDRPHGVLGLAEKIEIVEDLHRLGIPRGPLRRPLLSAPTTASRRRRRWRCTRWCPLTSRTRPVALKGEQILKIVTR